MRPLLSSQRFQIFLLFLLLLPALDAAASEMASQQCGECHESQFANWQKAKHSTTGVTCQGCHGEFHSGALIGCTSCHSTIEHKVNFKEWELVKDYMAEDDETDYYCIVCHDPHHPKKEKVLLCNNCHGPDVPKVQPRAAFKTSIQKAHDTFAKVAPAVNDDKWNRRFKSKGGKLLLGSGVVIIAVLIIFPYFYTGFAFLRWLKRKLRRKRQ
jgi:hypothetical protein